MIWQQETIFDLSLYGCKPSPESDFFFFCVGQQRLNYWPCLPVNIVTKNTEARCANSLHGPQCRVPNKEKQQIFDESLTSLSQPELRSCFLAEDIFMCVAVSIVPPEVFFLHFQIILPFTCTPSVVPSWDWTVSRCVRSLQSHVHCLAHWRANSENILWSTPLRQSCFRQGYHDLSSQKFKALKSCQATCVPLKRSKPWNHVNLPGSRLEVSSWRPPISTRPLRRRRSRRSRTRTSHCSTWGQD